jgi:ADP-ribose pyrophosphatase YjhB (NUDIX family)
MIHPRFTATAGAIVLDANDRVLLLKHRYRSGSGWGIPGGFMERHEQPLEALKRELTEEVGLTITDERITHVRSFPHLKQVEMIFTCRAQSEAKPKSGEVIEAEWFSIEELPIGLPQDQATIIRNVLANRSRY